MRYPWIKAALPHIISRIASGEYASHIATQLGMPKTSLNYHLTQSDDYRQAQVVAHNTRIVRLTTSTLNSYIARSRASTISRLRYHAAAYDRYLARREAKLAAKAASQSSSAVDTQVDDTGKSGT